MTTMTTTTNLKNFDLILINSSGGKDSQAMLDHMVRQATREGVRDRLVVVHADLGRVEWLGTRELAEYQAATYGIPFVAVSRTSGDILDHVEARGFWPSSKARFCTSDHKRDQVAKVVRRIAGERQAVNVLNCLGLRAQESSARAKKEVIVKDNRTSTKTREVFTFHPILDWTEDQVWATIEDSGRPSHFAYALGMPRLSCVFCIFAPEAALILAGQENPWLLKDFVRVEKKIGHTFKANLSIESIQAKIQAGAQAATVADWTM